jgi:membrane-bound ClpP family serine protease
MSISVIGVILLILIGLFLLVLELFVLPGISIAAIGSFCFIAGGIIMAYTKLGFPAGNITLLFCIVSVIITIYFSLKPQTWKRMTLLTNIDSKALDTAHYGKIKPGDFGKAVSRLAPIGNVLINDHIFEAQSTGDFIDSGTEIEVVKVDNSKIIIKPR